MNRARRVVPKREGGSPHTDETTYAHERSRFTTTHCRHGAPVPCPPGRVQGGAPAPGTAGLAVLSCLDNARPMGDGRGR
jgi:hypothetical protein